MQPLIHKFSFIHFFFKFLDHSVQVLPAEKALTLDDVEANLKHLRAELHEAKSRNIYLYNLVEEQKR